MTKIHNNQLVSRYGQQAFVTILLAGCFMSSHAALQISMPITGKNLQGVQQVELNLSAIAAANNSGQQLHVIDANQQVMPMRVDRPLSPPQRLNFGLQLYRWPATEIFSNAQSLKQLQLQLKQGEQQATVVFPDQPAINLKQQGTDQTWLLVSPKLPENLAADYLELQWEAADFSSSVQVEGSHNLVDWQFAGVGQILQTKNPAGQPLLQQRVEVNQPYAYWRIRFDQPLKLQQARLNSTTTRLPMWQQQPLAFQHTANQNNTSQSHQWQLHLTYPVAIQKLKFDIPPNQLWSVKVEAKQYENGRDYWQPLAQTELYHWQNNPDVDASVASSAPVNQLNEVEWTAPLSASDWRLTIQAPNLAKVNTLPVQAFAPQANLLFLAQGNSPYRLVINAMGNKPAPSLPPHLTAGQTQQLGEITVQENMVSNRQYGLWAGLILLVGILAFAAWRLFKGMQADERDLN